MKPPAPARFTLGFLGTGMGFLKGFLPFVAAPVFFVVAIGFPCSLFLLFVRLRPGPSPRFVSEHPSSGRKTKLQRHRPLKIPWCTRLPNQLNRTNPTSCHHRWSCLPLFSEGPLTEPFSGLLNQGYRTSALWQGAPEHARAI